jgi:putative transposase
MKYSKRLRKLDNKRNRQVEDYLNKAVSTLVNKAKEQNIDEIIIGWNNYLKTYGIKNEDLKGKDKRRINQTFIQIPLSRFKDKLVFKCKQIGIKTIVMNESYTSKSSFYDNDPIIKGNYSGERITRSLYLTKEKRIINADINAALNIYKKAINTCNSTNNKINYLMSRGLTIPKRVLVTL